jgi:hypothetical protein
MGGAKDQDEVTARLYAVDKAARDALHRYTGVYDSSTIWIEQAHVMDVPPLEPIWADIVEQVQEAPFYMTFFAVRYRIYCLEV